MNEKILNLFSPESSWKKVVEGGYVQDLVSNDDPGYLNLGKVSKFNSPILISIKNNILEKKYNFQKNLR